MEASSSLLENSGESSLNTWAAFKPVFFLWRLFGAQQLMGYQLIICQWPQTIIEHRGLKEKVEQNIFEKSESYLRFYESGECNICMHLSSLQHFCVSRSLHSVLFKNLKFESRKANISSTKTFRRPFFSLVLKRSVVSFFVYSTRKEKPRTVVGIRVSSHIIKHQLICIFKFFK